ncbi:putative Collagen alpha-3(VI) chain [Hypsibius exemplaris]|uniref:Collagen alpha-3(VI) chain n=1 Tax=Hypsibius exemplaris TaxID=2072580 RepID=A0A1W0WVM5_HYPEX|nr:putative Collagen alpha-3(VI) chain [Hypsibius exemplaris]
MAILGRLILFLVVAIVRQTSRVEAGQPEIIDSSRALPPGTDQTLLVEQKGPLVVQAAIEKITEQCIFKNDKQMLRVMALLESNYGKEANTFRKGYYGGIWQISERMFNYTQTSPQLSHFSRQFLSAFNIDWQTVTWRDLTKPFYSALAARLVIAAASAETTSRNIVIADTEEKSILDGAIPWSASEQARVWMNAYEKSPELVGDYVDAARRMINSSRCNSVGADIAFIMDSSGSVGAEAFQESLNFVAQVVDALDIGTNRNRIAFISYSSNTHAAAFHFNTYTAKSEIIHHILNTPWQAGMTPTAQALETVYQTVFTEENGSRKNQNFPQIAVLVTDGISDSPVETLQAAGNVHASKIRVISVGVGHGINPYELEAVASEPKCQNLYHLQNYGDMADIFAMEIEERSCSEPAVIVVPPIDEEEDGGGSGSRPPTITVILQPGQVQHFCFETSSMHGVTLIINGTSGHLTVYLSFGIDRPNDANYDRKYNVQAGQLNTEYLTRAIIASFTGNISATEVRICITIESAPILVVNPTITTTTALNPGEELPEATTSGSDIVTSSTGETEGGGSAGIHVIPIIANCGARMFNLTDGQEVTITSPGFEASDSGSPPGYSRNLNCVWQLQSPAWTHLLVTVQYFQLARNPAVPFSVQCKEQDRVTFTNRFGKIEATGNWCGGKEMGVSLQTTTNETKVAFTTLRNASMGHGFSLKVRAVAKHEIFCEPGRIRLALRKQFLQPIIPVTAYHLADESCRARDDGAEVALQTGYRQCGTEIQLDEDTISFTNQVDAKFEDFGHGVISRPTTEHIPFRCRLDRQIGAPVSDVYTSLRSERAALAGTRPTKPFLEGSINLQTGLHIYLDSGFDGESEPAFDYYDSGWDRVYIEAAIDNGADSTLRVQAEECWTTPAALEIGGSIRYLFIQDGCPVDDYQSTFQRHDSEPWQDRFSIESFQFHGTSSSEIHFHCKLRICMDGIDEEACRHDCSTRARETRRHDSEKTDEQKYPLTASRTVESGPIRIR